MDIINLTAKSTSGVNRIMQTWRSVHHRYLGYDL